MTSKFRAVIALCLSAIFISAYLFSEMLYENVFKVSPSTVIARAENSEINIAVVVCGEKFYEALVMIKSVLIFNQLKTLPIKLMIITEDQLMQHFQVKLSYWKQQWKHFRFEILSLQFPSENMLEWKRLFKPCAAQRLFLPSILKSIDSVIYTDTDVLFLSSVEDVWNHFKEFNKTQFAAVTPEHEDGNVGWYNRFARHPYYGPLGINSGVMLMNLTRMREFKWVSHILSIYTKYKHKIVFGDQDIINILFYYYPEKLFVMPCEYNYRPDHCMYMSVCNTTQRGIKLLHGNRGYFHSNNQPVFRLIYETIQSYSVDQSVQGQFLSLLKRLTDIPIVMKTNCDKAVKTSLYMMNKYKGYLV